MKKNNPTSPTIKKLADEIASLQINGKGQFYECFSNFVDLQLSFFCNNPTDSQKRLFAKVKKDSRLAERFATAATTFADLAECFKDPLGQIFTEYVSHGELGQFFTPDSICDLMCAITQPYNGCSVSDPACGSGRTLLAALKHARATGGDLAIYANDLSLTCAKMTLLNLCVNSATGEVSRGNTLMLDYENFTFFHLDRLRHIVSGKILSTYWQYTLKTAQEVSQERVNWWRNVMSLGYVWQPVRADRQKVEPGEQLPIDIEPIVGADGQTAMNIL